MLGVDGVRGEVPAVDVVGAIPYGVHCLHLRHQTLLVLLGCRGPTPRPRPPAPCLRNWICDTPPPTAAVSRASEADVYPKKNKKFEKLKKAFMAMERAVGKKRANVHKIGETQATSPCISGTYI